MGANLGEGRVGLNICFDSCYPYIIRDTAQLPGVDLIALPTIDPESPHAFLAAMHAAYTPFRAAESGVPIIRADAHAFSMIVDAGGRIIAEAPPGERLVYARVDRETRVTFARRLGDWFLYVLGLAVVMGTLGIAGKHTQCSTAPSDAPASKSQSPASAR